MINYPHHSPSRLNLFCASISTFVSEYILGLRQTVGPPAHRGSAVEEGVTLGLLDPKASLKSCINKSLVKYDQLTMLSGDPRRERYRDTIGDMVEIALKELRQYGIPTATQGRRSWHPEGLRYEIMGYFDYEWEQHGILADLKTTEKMPSQIKVPHARQVALYAGSDNIDARLIYVTPKKLAPYRLEHISAHRHALYSIAKRVENFLSLSDDPHFFVSITAPDLESFYWTSPGARQLAYELWGA